MVWTFAQIRGIPLRLHVSMLILLPMIAVGLGGDHLLGLVQALGHTPAELILPPIMNGVLIALGLFISILVHELGHAIAAQRSGCRVKSITIMLLGGITHIEQKPNTSAQESFKIAVAGPLMNVLIGVISFVVARLAVDSLDAIVVFGIVGSANLFIAGLNLIPAFPLDGGRILEAVLWGTLGESRGRKMAASISRFVALFCGMLALLNGNLLLLIFAIFLFLGSVTQKALAERKTKDDGTMNLAQTQLHRVLQIAESVAPEQAIDEMRRNGCLLALVRSVKGRLLGLIDIDTLERMNLPSLTGVPLHRFRSVHLGELSDLRARASHDWFLVYDEYNVLLGATRVDV